MKRGLDPGAGRSPHATSPAGRGTWLLAFFLVVAAGSLVGATACAGTGDEASVPGTEAGADVGRPAPEATPAATPEATPEAKSGSAPPSTAAPLRRLRVEVVETHPHDREAFTQGLLLDPEDPSALLESTGRYGFSQLRRVDLASGQVVRRVALADDLFAEGLARIPGRGPDEPARLVQLTWRAGVAKVWHAATFEALGEHRYAGEGWGLCYDAAGDRLVMSNGSPWLAFHDPHSFAETGGVEVHREGRPLPYLNELECVDGKVWANVYGTELLVEIDPGSGTVTREVDARGLLPAEELRGTDVMNGIAYDPRDGTFLLTGKWWPKLFRVRFVETEGPGSPAGATPGGSG